MLKRKIILSVLAILLVSFSAKAEVVEVKDVEKYLSGLTSFYAKFDQVIPGENFSRGELFIKKPGRFLWQYNYPNKVKIVSDGGLIYFVDQENGQVTQIPDPGILFSLLSVKNVDFSKGKLKLHDFQQSDKRVNVDLTTEVNGEDIFVTLIFEKQPSNKIELMKVVSTNQLKQAIVISFYEINEKAEIDKNIFKIKELDDELY